MSVRGLSRMGMATLGNLRVSVTSLCSRSPALTGFPSASFRLGFLYSPRIGRIHIIRRTGAPAAQHPFLRHPGCVRDTDRGRAWGVRAARSIAHLLYLVRAQDVEGAI